MQNPKNIMEGVVKLLDFFMIFLEYFASYIIFCGKIDQYPQGNA